MVFYFRLTSGLPPTTLECEEVAHNFGLWEDSGFGPGYAVLRGGDSAFESCQVVSIDPRSLASFLDGPFSRSGHIPGLAFDLLPTSMAPIVRWATDERGLATGRTYCVGLTLAAVDGSSDKEKLNFLYTDALATIFGVLESTVASGPYLKQCHYVRSSGRGAVSPPALLDITGHGVYQLVGSQRRRTRP